MWFCSVLIFNFNFCVHCQNAVCMCIYFQVTFLPEKERKQLTVSHYSLYVTLWILNLLMFSQNLVQI